MRLLTPDFSLPSLSALDEEFCILLDGRGIRGLLLDFDETLVASLAAGPSEEIVRWVERMQEKYCLFIVSNNSSSKRVASIAGPLGIPFLIRAAKPLLSGFRRALRELGLREGEVAVVGDQLFTDVLGGRRLGALTILVSPLSPETVWHRKWMRQAERLFASLFGDE